MSEQRRAPRQKPERLVAVPSRALAEAIEDFAAPLLEPLGPRPDLDQGRVALEFAVATWNFHVLVRPPWGGKRAMKEGLAGLERAARPPDSDLARRVLDQRWRARFSDDPRVVVSLRVLANAEAGLRLELEARTPENASITAGTPTPRGLPIAIGEWFLGEVGVPAGPTTSIGFPAARHAARVTEHEVTISAEAAVVAKLFADNALKPIGGPPVSLEIGGARLGRFVLTGLRVGERSAVDDVLDLTFRRPATLG